MPLPADPGVFVVYGRNVAAYQEMQKYLTTVGARECTFEDVSDLEANPFVTDVVIDCIQAATAVIVLFTPDELSMLYGPVPLIGSTKQTIVDYRWQPRPNVIFEAGIAFAHKREKTIIVTIGDDVTGFSDIAGVHVIRLTNKQGKNNLRKRLAKILNDLPATIRDDWMDPGVSGDFDSCNDKRWQPYDELSELEAALRAHAVSAKVKKGKKKKKRVAFVLFDVVSNVVKADAAMWRYRTPRNFMEEVKRVFGDKIADGTYWRLCVMGFFEFQDVDYWFDSDEWWEYAVDYSKYATRAIALMEKISKTSSLLPVPASSRRITGTGLSDL